MKQKIFSICVIQNKNSASKKRQNEEQQKIDVDVNVQIENETETKSEGESGSENDKVIFIRKIPTDPRNRLQRQVQKFFSDGKKKY